MNTATVVRHLTEWPGDATLYHLSHAVEYNTPSHEDDLPAKTTEYVIVYAVCSMITGDDTYIFPADEQGTVLSRTELEGSYLGGQSHEAALARAGFRRRDAP